MVSVTTNLIRAEHLDGQVAQAMLAQSPECIKVIDPSGQLLFMSENGLELMEIDDFGAVRGAFWWDLWPDRSHDTLREAIAAARRGVTIEFEASCPTAGGTPKHWKVRVSRVRGGQLDGMIVAASQDITQRVEADNARQRLADDNESLRRFTRFVAHDLRGPIRHNKLLAEMITMSEDGKPRSEAARLAREIEGSAEGMLNLLGGLEALHKLDESHARPEPLVLGDLADAVGNMFDRNRVRLTVAPEVRFVNVLADRDLMLSVLKNLVENSAKFSDIDGPADVDLMPHDPQGSDQNLVTFLVCDNGPGFAEDRFEDLFEPLVRQSNVGPVAGSGLGLSIVRGLVERQNGIVRALRSRPDGQRGAAVLLGLPRAQEVGYVQ